MEGVDDGDWRKSGQCTGAVQRLRIEISSSMGCDQELAGMK
jgi:hypothetical protein